MKALNSIGPSHLRGSDRESARPRGLRSRATGPGVLPVWIVVILLTVPAAAQTTEFGNPYVIGAAMQSLTGPDGTNRLNCVLPENNGGYVAVWDVGNTAVVERRSPAWITGSTSRERSRATCRSSGDPSNPWATTGKP